MGGLALLAVIASGAWLSRSLLGPLRDAADPAAAADAIAREIG